jgi:hypothetical protein
MLRHASDRAVYCSSPKLYLFLKAKYGAGELKAGLGLPVCEHTYTYNRKEQLMLAANRGFWYRFISLQVLHTNDKRRHL